MSNIEAAATYADIIEEVIAESRQDFENSGIDEATLQDLRKIWMDKLAQSQVAEFSWTQRAADVGETLDDSNSLALHTSGGDNLYPNVAVIQQAQEQVHQQHPSISDLNATTPAPGLEYPSVTGGAKAESPGLVLPTGGRIVNQGDGNFELTIEVESRDEAIQYMKNLKKRNRKKCKIIRQADGIDSDDDDDLKDEDEFGSDDINSDLDDSDSLESEDDNDDQEGNIMLCLYDKVQRVKNKWKCNLKEGIASLNGKDYTFQKATSESEW